MKKSRGILEITLAVSLVISSLITSCGSTTNTSNDTNTEEAAKETSPSSQASVSESASDNSPETTENITTSQTEETAEPEVNYVITGDYEIDRAIYLGLVTEDEVQSDFDTVSGKELYLVLDRLFEIVNPDGFSKYKKEFLSARNRKGAFNRYEAMLGFYQAAQMMGDDYNNVATMDIPGPTLGKLGEGWQDNIQDYNNVYSPAHVNTEIGGELISVFEASLIYALGRVNVQTGNTLFLYDEDANSMHLENPLTWFDCVKAAERLYDSVASNDYMLFDIKYSASSNPDAQKTASKTSTKIEFLRAVEYGFVDSSIASSAANDPIKWSEYCEMIAKMLELVDTNVADEFRKDAAYALKNDDYMYIYQGCLPLYQASTFMGINHRQSQEHSEGKPSYRNPFNIDYTNIGMSDYSGYTGNNDDILDEMVIGDYSEDPMRLWLMSLLYCYDRTSLVSFETLMPLKKTPSTYLCVEDAVNSVIRLYESRYDYADSYWMEKEASLNQFIVNNPVENAEKRRSDILKSNTSIEKSNEFIPGETYTGTAYYVSGNGNDSNDGKTPETAWASIERVRDAKEIKSGDAVFFERGCVFRGTMSSEVSGVTYSAYGTGDKPIITTATEEAADPALWELYYDKNGVKIWKYARDLVDCGSIIFDNEKAGFKVTAGWTKDGRWINEDGTPFALEESLTENLDFFSDDGGKCGGKLNYTIGDSMQSSSKDIVYGPLYLRCDKGNPGDLFKNIELGTMAIDPYRNHGYFGDGFHVGTDCVIDNISVRYYPQLGIDYRDGQTIQNCEVCWGGGCTQIVKEGFVDGRAGDAFTGINQNNVTIRNCYIHDIFTNGLDNESPNDDCSDFEMTGNLYERCEAVNVNYGNCAGLNRFVFADNIVVGSGTGWGARSYIRSHLYRNDWEWFYNVRIADATTLEDCSIKDNSFYYPLMFVFHLNETVPEIALENNEYYYADESSYFAFWRTDRPNGKADEITERPDIYETIDQTEADDFISNYGF